MSGYVFGVEEENVREHALGSKTERQGVSDKERFRNRKTRKGFRNTGRKWFRNRKKSGFGTERERGFGTERERGILKQKEKGDSEQIEKVVLEQKEEEVLEQKANGERKEQASVARARACVCAPRKYAHLHSPFIDVSVCVVGDDGWQHRPSHHRRLRLGRHVENRPVGNGRDGDADRGHGRAPRRLRHEEGEQVGLRAGVVGRGHQYERAAGEHVVDVQRRAEARRFNAALR
eukprot:4471775-Pleurochrysis_carterae.AAC.2